LLGIILGLGAVGLLGAFAVVLLVLVLAAAALAAIAITWQETGVCQKSVNVMAGLGLLAVSEYLLTELGLGNSETLKGTINAIAVVVGVIIEDSVNKSCGSGGH